MNYSVEVFWEENDHFTSFLKQKIKEYNNEKSVYHNEARKKGAVQPLNIIVVDNNNKWIGGIVAEIYWNWLEITDFWLSKEVRGDGLGTLVLDQAEKLARDKGATKVLLTTFEFQARTFYEAKGYMVVGEVKDYPPGSSYYTLVKSL